jgi:tripartite-type tricarboxylate transporter receptor subunit TctC
MLPTNTHAILPTLAMLTSDNTLPGVSKKTGDPVTVLFRVLLCCALVALAGDGSAQTWPSRPIKLVVPTGPGAATDVMARLLADGVSRTLSQAMVVENMPGASGLLAHQSVARAQPDGYTLLFTNTSEWRSISFPSSSSPTTPRATSRRSLWCAA